LSYIKKKFNCNGSIVNDEKYGEVMTFTGDQKKNIYDFLIKEEINKKDEIILKGI
jgi:translation initiation factor 1